MASKKKLRAEIERLRVSRAGYRTALLDAAAECTCPALGVAAPAVQQPWAAHLARVADAAYREGRRRADDAAYRKGYAAAIYDVTASDPQPQPDTAPEDAKPAGDEVNRFSADGPCCGFACCCQHPPVAGWTPGSVTR